MPVMKNIVDLIASVWSVFAEHSGIDKLVQETI